MATSYEQKKTIALICMRELVRRPEYAEKVAEVIANMGRGIGTYWLQEIQDAVNNPRPDEAEVTRVQQSGLNRNQARRVIEIRESMSKLEAEAKEIVKPTPEELRNSIDCYADNGCYDLAERMAESWGSWEDILEDRISAAEIRSASSSSFKPSLDRINSRKGYTRNNIKIVWVIENLARNNFSEDQLIEFCRRKLKLL